MCRLVESIKIEDGEIVNPSLHSKRMNESRSDLFNSADCMHVQDIVSVPETCMEGIYKCRIIYAETILGITFEQYRRREIHSLKLVHNDTIDYSYKYENRQPLLSLLERKEHCDDILIVKGGMITDTSFSNIAFFDGQAWFTPATPLLKGTKRAYLIAEGLIREAELTVRDIPLFHHASLINAMLEPGETVLPVKNIV